MSLATLQKGSKLHVPKYGLLAAAILAVIAGIIVMSVRRSAPRSNNAVATIKLSRGTVKETYSATGQLIPVTTKTIHAVASGVVTALKVHVGEKVSASQGLATLISPSLSQSVSNAQHLLQQAQNQVTLLRSPLTTQHAELKIASAKNAVTTAQNQLTTVIATGRVTSNTSGIWTTTLTEGGTVQAGQNVGFVGKSPASAPSAGTITSIPSQNGQSVSAGSLLMTLTSPSLSAAITNDRLAVVDAEIALQQTEQQYSTTALTSQLAQAEATVAADQSTIQGLESNVAALDIRSPFAGVVTAVSTAIGKSVSSGASLVTIDSRQLYMSFPVTQSQMRSLAIGQPATINTQTVNALGHIANVGYVGTYSGGVSSFPVTISVPLMSGLRPGMSAQASITIKSVSHAFVVPLEALHQKGNRTTVLVQHRSGHPSSIPVTVLLANSLDAAIQSTSLRSGMPIIIATATPNTTTKLHVKGKPAHPGHGKHGKP